MQLSFVLSVVAFVASATAAVVPNSAVESTLHKRQDGCELYCTPLANANSACNGDVTCLCSGTAAALVYTCGTCKYQRDTTQYAALQQEIDPFIAMQLSVVLSFVALIASATAAAVPNNVVEPSLTKRQDPCAIYCQPLATANTQCNSDPTCLCSGQVAALMYTCSTCSYQHDTTQYAALQQQLDQYSANCATINSPVGALPIPYCSAPVATAPRVIETSASPQDMGFFT
ncbi:hypothetical protein FRC01_005704 [Tulasnella sp. 417]|nr:hypothetical protein FRC01_005704 [Tulasnella sp. 417]